MGCEYRGKIKVIRIYKCALCGESRSTHRQEATEASDAGSEEPNVEGTADLTVEVSTRQSG